MKPEPPAGWQEHRAGYEASRLGRDRTLRAIRSLELALGRAARGDTWLGDVEAALEALQVAMAAEIEDIARPDSLVAMIAAEQPRRYGWRVRSLREQYDDIVRQLISLRGQVALGDEDQVDAGDLRHRVGWLLNALHQCRARQTDLVYEALDLDLGEGA